MRTTSDAPIGVTPELADEARRAGLARARQLSLERVEARRTELWAVMFLALVGVGLILALIAVGDHDPSLRSFIVTLPAFRFGLVLVLAGFGGYVFEQERHLRRLSTLLVEQRVASEKQADRLAWLTAVDALKSELVDDLERDVGAALSVLRDSIAMLDPTDTAQSRLFEIVHRDVDRADEVLRAHVERHDRALLERARAKGSSPVVDETPAASASGEPALAR